MRLPADMIHHCSANACESDHVMRLRAPPRQPLRDRMQITFTQST